MAIFDLFLLALMAVFLFVGFQPKLQNNPHWQLIVTPLASIIGSGFLVVAPLLGATVGSAAPWAMLGIVVLAYGIGAIIRFNIREAEPLLRTSSHGVGLILTERVSNIMLTIAYVVSVAFYLRLLSAFVLRGVSIDSDIAANLLTTALLLAIALVGWAQGLAGLERLEKYSVTVKLCIILVLLVSLAYFDVQQGFQTVALASEPRPLWDTIRILGGMLIVVQGFETSRYLGADYDASSRAQGMQRAQLIAAAIYLGFVFLITPLLHGVDFTSIDETSVIDLVSRVAFVLPMMLIVAAITSQFSAAVADTVGAGGLVAEESNHRLPARAGYLVICLLAIVLIWISNIFDIIALASRAFAAYYLVQTLLAIQVVHIRFDGAQRLYRQGALSLAAAGLLWICLFAKAAG